MNKILESQFVFEKQAFSKLLIGTSMLEITYSETFNLIFYKYINNSENSDYKWTVQKLNLIIDAPFWITEKSQWEECVKDNNDVMPMDDNMLAYELVNIRYNNLIQVQDVVFFEDYLHIFLEGNKILSIAYCSDSEYSWILEEVSDKSPQEKIMVLCQDGELFAKNIPEIL